jgi:hypothetical protein
VPLRHLWSVGTIACFCIVAFTANAWSQAFPAAAGTAVVSGDAGRCTVREVGRDSLMLGGRRLFFTPHAFETNSAGEMFIAGDLYALLEQDSAGVWRPVVMDSVLGAVVSPEGTPRLVRAPITNRLLGDVGVAPNSDGSWTVVYGERIESEDTPPDFKARTIRRLWSGIVRGAELTMLDTLPHPEGWGMSADLSPLARTGDTLALALIARAPDQFRRMLVFERREGRWAYDSLPTRFGIYAAPAYSPVSGLVLATVESDPYTPEDNGNSLFLWHRRGEWARTRRVISALQQQVHRPSLRFRADGSGSLTWMSPAPPEEGGAWRAFAMIGDVGERNEPTMMIEPSASFWNHVFALPFDPRSDLWITVHEPRADEPSEIRFVDRGGRLLHHQPNPYLGSVASLKSRNGEYVVAGGVYNAEQLHVTTVLLRFRVDCAA